MEKYFNEPSFVNSIELNWSFYYNNKVSVNCMIVLITVGFFIILYNYKKKILKKYILLAVAGLIILCLGTFFLFSRESEGALALGPYLYDWERIDWSKFSDIDPYVNYRGLQHYMEIYINVYKDHLNISLIEHFFVPRKVTYFLPFEEKDSIFLQESEIIKLCSSPWNKSDDLLKKFEYVNIDPYSYSYEKSKKVSINYVVNKDKSTFNHLVLLNENAIKLNLPINVPIKIIVEIADENVHCVELRRLPKLSTFLNVNDTTNINISVVLNGRPGKQWILLQNQACYHWIFNIKLENSGTIIMPLDTQTEHYMKKVIMRRKFNI